MDNGNGDQLDEIVVPLTTCAMCDGVGFMDGTKWIHGAFAVDWRPMTTRLVLLAAIIALVALALVNRLR